MRYGIVCEKQKRGYCARRHGGIICYKKTRFYCSVCSIHKMVYYCHGLTRTSSEISNCFLERKNCIGVPKVD